MLPAALQAVAGCNSVLGIEPAELGETTQALNCFWPAQDPTQDCAPCDDCASQCQVDDCLKDRNCRKGLAAYRKCVGDSCAENGNACVGCTQGSPLAQQTAKCLNNCHCNLARATTLCETYCACMDSRCPANEPGGAKSACISACLQGTKDLQLPDQQLQTAVATLWEKPPEEWMIYCFWQHCERGEDVNDIPHCDHAVGDAQSSVCPGPKAPEDGAPVCEFPKGYQNAPCNEDDDCCSTCDKDLKICGAL